jgi:hypothetical protein
VRHAAILALFVVAFGALASSNGRTERPIVVVGANESFNWSGYMQGTLEKGTPFHAVAADWIVPKVKQRNPGEAEYSSSWIGIGGGCLDAGCTISDSTLIQAGIGHDVDAAGNPDYYAWWETIPAPSVRTDLAVHPGDLVHVDITEGAVPELWTITIADRTTGSAFTITLPYPSTYATAEWILETPIVISDTGGITVGPMPDVAPVHFDRARTNGAGARLLASEQVELVDFDLSLIAAPSSPDRDADGFNDCAYRKTCPTPGNELP